jgi:hypothetical protein
MRFALRGFVLDYLESFPGRNHACFIELRSKINTQNLGIDNVNINK